MLLCCRHSLIWNATHMAAAVYHKVKLGLVYIWSLYKHRDLHQQQLRT